MVQDKSNLIDNIFNEYEAEKDVITNDVEELIKDLAEEKIIEEVENI